MGLQKLSPRRQKPLCQLLRQAPLKKQVEQSIQKSLENLRTSYIDSLMMHSPMPTLEENLEAHSSWRSVGLSTWTLRFSYWTPSEGRSRTHKQSALHKQLTIVELLTTPCDQIVNLFICVVFNCCILIRVRGCHCDRALSPSEPTAHSPQRRKVWGVFEQAGG